MQDQELEVKSGADEAELASAEVPAQEVVEQAEPVEYKEPIELPEAPKTVNELANVHKLLGDAYRGLSLD